MLAFITRQFCVLVYTGHKFDQTIIEKRIRRTCLAGLGAVKRQGDLVPLPQLAADLWRSRRNSQLFKNSLVCQRRIVDRGEDVFRLADNGEARARILRESAP